MTERERDKKLEVLMGHALAEAGALIPEHWSKSERSCYAAGIGAGVGIAFRHLQAEVEALTEFRKRARAGEKDGK